ncbi:MAG: hypothetical protein AAF715_17160, partial [Myxococcota bacterium]
MVENSPSASFDTFRAKVGEGYPDMDEEAEAKRRRDVPGTASADLVIASRDGYPLAATRFGSVAAPDWVIMNSATAVPRRVYRRVAPPGGAARVGGHPKEKRRVG